MRNCKVKSRFEYIFMKSPALAFVTIFVLSIILTLPVSAEIKEKCSDLAPVTYPPSPNPFAQAIPGNITKNYKYEAHVSDPSVCTVANFDALSCRYKFNVEESERRTCNKFLKGGKNSILSADMQYYTTATLKAIENYQNAWDTFEDRCQQISYRVDPRGGCNTVQETKPCGVSSVKMIGSQCVADVTCSERWSCQPRKLAGTGGGTGNY